MLSAKPWRSEAVVRLGIGLFTCIYAGALLLSAFHAAGTAKAGWGFYSLLVLSLGCLGTTLALLHKPWGYESVMRRLMILMTCFYAGLFLGACVQKIAGPAAASAGQMVVGVLSFQGAALLLAGRFLQDHQTTWREGFGLSNCRGHALLLGLILACLFLPVGYGLQWLSAEAMVHLPRLKLNPEDQQAVQTLAATTNWAQRWAFGLVTIFLVPPAEETLFRGILYPWIKQAGWPRVALWGTSLFFALVHFNLASFLPLTVFALLLTALYERTDNLLAPVAAHAMFNALNFARLCMLDKT